MLDIASGIRMRRRGLDRRGDPLHLCRECLAYFLGHGRVRDHLRDLVRGRCRELARSAADGNDLDYVAGGVVVDGD
jgi:hypothetical protein